MGCGTKTWVQPYYGHETKPSQQVGRSGSSLRSSSAPGVATGTDNPFSAGSNNQKHLRIIWEPRSDSLAPEESVSMDLACVCRGTMTVTTPGHLIHTWLFNIVLEKGWKKYMHVIPAYHCNLKHHRAFVCCLDKTMNLNLKSCFI